MNPEAPSNPPGSRTDVVADRPWITAGDTPYSAHMNRVVDGDTIRVGITLPAGVRLKQFPVRLIGIQSPELGTADAWAASAARLQLIHRVGAAQLVLVNPRGKTDRYGRMLAWVWRRSGDTMVSVQHQMVDTGHAWWWWPKNDRSAGHVPPPEVDLRPEAQTGEDWY